MKRTVEQNSVVVNSTPPSKIGKVGETDPSLGQDENRCSNTEQPLETNSIPEATVPSAREIAAAKAARIRLGLEVADPNDPAASKPSDVMEGKLPDGAEPEKVEIVNLPTDQLTAVQNVESELSTLADRLGSPNWVTACEGLNTTRQLAIHNPDELKTHLECFIPLIHKSVKNLRSAVQKSALICLCDLVASYKDEVLRLLAAQKTTPTPILLLLQRAAQDKKFVADEAQKLLQAVGSTCLPALTRETFMPQAANKAPKVRAEAAKVIGLALASEYSSEGHAGIMSEGGCFRDLLKLTGTLISDAQPAARTAAQGLALTLHSAFSDSQATAEAPLSWEDACAKELSTTAAQKVIKYCADNKKN